MKAKAAVAPLYLAVALCGCASLGPSGDRFSTELPSEQAALACFATAEELASREHNQEAIDMYLRARRFDPNLEGVSRRLAVLYDKEWNVEAARKEYDLALKEDSRDASLWNDFGYFHYQHERWDQAEQAFRRALDLKRDFERAQVNLALTLAEQRRYDESFDAFQVVVSESAARHNLGTILARHGDQEQAKQMLRNAIDLEPALEQPRRVLAWLTGSEQQQPIVRPYDTPAPIEPLMSAEMAPMLAESQSEPDRRVPQGQEPIVLASQPELQPVESNEVEASVIEPAEVVTAMQPIEDQHVSELPRTRSADNTATGMLAGAAWQKDGGSSTDALTTSSFEGSDASVLEQTEATELFETGESRRDAGRNEAVPASFAAEEEIEPTQGESSGDEVSRNAVADAKQYEQSWSFEESDATTAINPDHQPASESPQAADGSDDEPAQFPTALFGDGGLATEKLRFAISQERTVPKPHVVDAEVPPRPKADTPATATTPKPPAGRATLTPDNNDGQHVPESNSAPAAADAPARVTLAPTAP